MSVAVTERNLKQKALEAKKNTYIAYEIGEYYYALANYKKAVEWYEKAASGSPEVPMALYAMGYACQNGEGTDVDLIRAFQYYEEAAKKDLPQACYNLAYFYQNGIGVSRDLKKAEYYCERATESLKRLVDASQEAKQQLHQMKIDQSQLISSVLEKENKWLDICNESAKKSRKIGELETLNGEHIKTAAKLKDAIRAKEKDLQEKEEQYEKIVLLHGETLGLIDRLNDDLRKSKRQIDELHDKYAAEKSKNEFIEGKNNQLENERNNLIQAQAALREELIAAQKQIVELSEKLSAANTSNDNLLMELKLIKEQGDKIKKQRNIYLASTIIMAAIATVSFFI